MENLKYKSFDRVLICAEAKIIDVEPGNATNRTYFVELDPYTFSDDCAWIGEDDILCELGGTSKITYNDGYEQGLNDAWEMANFLHKCVTDSGLTAGEMYEIYESSHPGYIITHFSAQETIDKYNAWKEKRKFKMGDVVEFDVAGGCERAIFYSEGPQVWWLLSKDNTEPLYLCKEDFALRKIGESGLDIPGALANIEKLSETSVKAGREYVYERNYI